MNVDFSRLYIMEDERKRRGVAACYEFGASEEEGRRRLHRLLLGEEAPAERVLFRWEEGCHLYDSLQTTIPCRLFSNRVFDLLEISGATGWSSFPVELRGKNGERIDGYRGLAVTGRCGQLQYERSLSETRIGRSGQPYRVWTGLYFDEASWDGSDVFLASDATFVFVTERVVRALKEAEVTNVVFERMSTFERMWRN